MSFRDQAKQWFDEAKRDLDVGELLKNSGVDKLAEMLGAPGELEAQGAHLTAEYVSSRYPEMVPGPSEVYTVQAAATRLDDARGLVEWVERSLARG